MSQWRPKKGLDNGQNEGANQVNQRAADDGYHPEPPAQDFIVIVIGNFIQALDIGARPFNLKSA